MKDIYKPNTPVYLHLYEKIKTDIIKGIYPYGKKLPSKRILASEMGVSIITVAHSYALLCDEGYVESRERSGFFVIFRQVDRFAGSAERTIPSRTRHRHDAAVSLDFPFSVLTKTMRRVMNDYGETILEKSPNFGCQELRVAIQKYLARNRNIYADVEQIIIGSGAEYLYGSIVGILGRDKCIALESPSYEKIEKVYLTAGISCQRLPLDCDGIESHALSQSHADALHISPYRSFPTGITASASKRHEYLRWADTGERWIIEDDFESEFSVSSKPEETLFSLSNADNVIYLNTFSKTISPALRVGYMVLPKCLLNRFSDNLGFYSCTVPTFEQFVLAELIVSGDFERHINRVRRKKRKELLDRT